MPTRQASTIKREPHILDLRSLALSTGVAIVCAVPLGIVWFVVALELFFSSGGKFGLFGEPEVSPAAWVLPIQVLLLLVAIGLDLWAAAAFYRRHYKPR